MGKQAKVYKKKNRIRIEINLIIDTHTLYVQTPKALQSNCLQEAFQFLQYAKIQAVENIQITYNIQ